ncbi:MAG: hypothetical protein QOF16_192 [Actinomycetota bacterium]|nr:hypothetical protein [Actinomycetota bacterium]MEA2486538.1 hypothetical protein [Actinomycetota bacterium]
MATGDRPPGRWETEATTPTGGHLPPDNSASGSLFEPLDPYPVTEPPLDPPPIARPPGNIPTVRQRPSLRRRLPIRRVKRTLRHIDPVSVLKLSAFYYAVFLVIWMLFAAVVYFILKSAGTFDKIEKIATSFAFSLHLHITLLWVEKWAFLIGLVFLVIASIVNLFLAFVYNFAADIVGGVELTFMEKDL